MFTKDEFLEIIQHLDITESPPPDVATDMDLVAAPEAPALSEVCLLGFHYLVVPY